MTALCWLNFVINGESMNSVPDSVMDSCKHVDINILSYSEFMRTAVPMKW